MKKKSASHRERTPVSGQLKLDKSFQPCASEPGDELYPNGIFIFNITRLMAFIEAYMDEFPVEPVELADIPDFGEEHLNEDAVLAADPSRPILLAEISPGRYNVIDGNHRVAKARREGAASLPAVRVHCPQHVPFLTTARGYVAYVEYWNSKLKDAIELTDGSSTGARG